MIKEYDRYLQTEAEEWFDEYDSETTDGFLEEIEDDENFIYQNTGIF